MNKLLEKRTTLYAQAQELVNKAQSEERAFTDEEKTSYQSAVAEIRSLDEQLKADQEIRTLALNKAQSKAGGENKEAQEIRAFEAFLRGDRGSQYTSEAFRETLSKMNIYQSLSGVAHCYDNARMESFFATLKKELLYRIPTYRMAIEEVKSTVFRYVFTYYNRTRIYTKNPFGLPPAVYRRLYKKQVA